MKFQLELTILILCNKFSQKRYFQSKTEKMNSALNSQYSDYISVGIKLQLKLTFLVFWNKFVQEEYFQSKMIKENSITEFFMLKLD